MALKTYSKKINQIKKNTNRIKRYLLFEELLSEQSRNEPVINSIQNSRVDKFCEYSKSAPGIYNCIPEVMATYYPQYQQESRYNYQKTMTDWSPIMSSVQAAPPVYTSSVALPIVLTTPQVVTQICPYTGALVSEPVLPPVMPNQVIAEIIPVVTNGYKPMVSYSLEPVLAPPLDVANDTYVVNKGLPLDQVTAEEVKYDDVQMDPAEFYLSLPKELFPTARMFSLDPNPIIDEFCKLVNINDNTSWILDLEFGIPKVPVTRAIPVYDVQFNSIHCKNTPGAIHPGFESCSNDFKRVFLFYYDCIISTWYKGYIIMNYDKSVKNFQSWLLLPMQIFGMCWP